MARQPDDTFAWWVMLAVVVACIAAGAATGRGCSGAMYPDDAGDDTPLWISVTAAS